MIRRPSRRRGTTQRRPPVTARTIKFLFFFFFPSFFTPPKRAKYGHFWADCFFFGRSCMQGGACKNKNKNGVQLKKHRRFQKNCRLRHWTPLTVRAILRTFTYGTEEVRIYLDVLCESTDTLFSALQMFWSRIRLLQSNSARGGVVFDSVENQSWIRWIIHHFFPESEIMVLLSSIRTSSFLLRTSIALA